MENKNINYEKFNTVDSKNQIKDNIFFFGNPEGSPRIMFVGNSVTKHEPKPDIGWEGRWGMAASAMDKDYVHRTVARVEETGVSAAYCIVQAAIWERTYRDCDYDKHFGPARAFKPDIIICVISANIPDAEFEHEAFVENMGKLHRYLADGCDVKIIQTSSAFNNERKSVAIEDYMNRVGGDYVYISDLPKSEENLAIGKFWHSGIQYHPGDLGMDRISERIFDKLKKYL